MFNVGKVTQLACSQKRALSVLAGMLVVRLGYDKAIAAFPEVVHHALAGVAADAFCRGTDVLDDTRFRETFMSAGFGVIGGAVAQMAMRGALPMLV